MANLNSLVWSLIRVSLGLITNGSLISAQSSNSLFFRSSNLLMILALIYSKSYSKQNSLRFSPGSSRITSRLSAILDRILKEM